MAYFSCRLTAAQCNYSASELECLAVLKAIDHFALYLLGQRFTVITDHSTLVALLNSNRLNERLMRWALALQAFDMDIKYRPWNSSSKCRWPLETVLANYGSKYQYNHRRDPSIAKRT